MVEVGGIEFILFITTCLQNNQREIVRRHNEFSLTTLDSVADRKAARHSSNCVFLFVFGILN